MRRFLKALDDAPPRLATFVHGPQAEGEERPSLLAKLGVIFMFAVLILLGLASSCARW